MSFTTDDYKAIFVTKTTFMSESAFDRAMQHAKVAKKPIEQVLMERAYISEAQYLQLLAAYCKVPATELRVGDVDRTAIKLVTPYLAEKLQAIPFKADDSSISVAFVDPLDEDALNELQQALQQTIKPYVTTQQAVQRALMLYDETLNAIFSKHLQNDEKHADDVSDILNGLVEAAVVLEASDIHLEPYEDALLVRMRVQGVLRVITEMAIELHKPLVTHLKIRSEMQVDETRLPQDGRFSADSHGQLVDVRVSLVPSMWGEKAVLRVLPKQARMLDIETLGLLEDDVEVVKKYLRHPSGMVLVCGPTGSGKTTTLYAFLQAVSSERIDVVNISTIEDPIEYTIPRVTQIQTKPSINLTFATGLRALLRQDPDIIMVGEIRDGETATFAVRAALIGRLVLSSLHTPDAVGAIPRLLDMGVEPYLVSSTVSLVIAQRLARKLCTYCRESYKPDDALLATLRSQHDLDSALVRLKKGGHITEGHDDLRFFRAVGCEHCDNTGYIGRTALFEILQMDDVLRHHATKQSDASTLRKVAIEQGMKTLFEDGLAKAFIGVVDLEELMRVAYE